MKNRSNSVRVRRGPAQLSVVVLVFCCCACSAMLGLDDYRADPASPQQAADPFACTSDAQCGTESPVGGVCSRTLHTCVPLLDLDCNRVLGPYADPNAWHIGTLLSTSGASAETNRMREQSARLAVEELNATGGVPTPAGARRPIALLSCDASQNLLRAGKHLVEDFGAVALLGPDASQDSLMLATALTIASNTLTISPTVVSSGLADLVDMDLSWSMSVTDRQQTTPLLQQIGQLEQLLAEERGSALRKLSVIMRADESTAAVRDALDELRFNGRTLDDPVNLNQRVRIVSYDASLPDQSVVVSATLAFAPDIIVLLGGAEAITTILAPLESRWITEVAQPGAPPPDYLLTASARVPALLRLAAAQRSLSPRVRGIGTIPAEEAQPVYRDFLQDYAERYDIDATDTTGVAESYDAMYALAYALSSQTAATTSGRRIARDLRILARGTAPGMTGPAASEATFQALTSGVRMRVIGGVGALEWDDSGMLANVRAEVWCLDAMAQRPAFRSSGVTFAVATQEVSDRSVHVCNAVRTPSPSSTTMTQTATRSRSPGSDLDGGVPPSGQAGSSDSEARELPDAAVSGPIDIGLVAEYVAANTDPHDNIVAPAIRLTNRSSDTPIPLARLRIRYYLSNEHSELCPDNCLVDSFYTGLQPSGTTTTASRRFVSGGTDGKQSYVELAFGATAPQLARGESVELQQQFHTNPYLEQDETNDYSYDSSSLLFSVWPRVTVHRGNVLVWGVPPPPAARY